MHRTRKEQERIGREIKGIQHRKRTKKKFEQKSGEVAEDSFIEMKVIPRGCWLHPIPGKISTHRFIYAQNNCAITGFQQLIDICFH